MTEWLNLTGGSLTLEIDGVKKVVLPEGQTVRFAPSGIVTVGEEIELAEPFTGFQSITILGTNGVPLAVQRHDHQAEFFQGFGLVVSLGIAAAVVRYAWRALARREIGGDGL